ncbi:MAG: SAM-dependent methyltransferase [Ignavibacteria bacterium]
MDAKATCPACGAEGLLIFYEAERVPVHSVLLMASREQALHYPKGDIRLGFCDACGFITNTVFDPTLHEYSSRYEETQAYSPTFNEFHHSLAQRLIERYDLHGKDIIEIGCGKGEFLRLLCELGNNRGIGVDPAYVPERNPGDERVRFIKDFYSEQYAHLRGDFIVCKMTLEHIHAVESFVGMVRRSIGDKMNATIFFQLPNVTSILREIVFWDMYYEHCSYFSKGSLARLFRRCGFHVHALSTEYNDQYLTIEATPSRHGESPQLAEEHDMVELRSLVRSFASLYPTTIHKWKHRVACLFDNGKKVVLWGAGSKGVAFLTALGISYETMPYAVDINPHKHGTFLAGTGQEIVSPRFLTTYRPDAVIVMNSIYEEEIRKELTELGVETTLITL